MAEYTSSYTGAQIDAAVGKFNGDMLEGVHCIELNKNGGSVGTGGFIDFHYNGSSSDYTSRIIENASGNLLIIADIDLDDGGRYIRWRANPTVESGIYYHTSGDEAMVFANKQPYTSWIFANTNPGNKTDWTTLGTPAMQIKNNTVYINKSVVTSNATPAYRLDVGGMVRATGGVSSGDYVSITHTTPYISFTNDEIGCDLDIMFSSDGRLHFENYDYGEYEFNGIVYADNYQSTSDMRKKNVISNITVDINDIANAPLFKFTWKDERMKGEHVGSSAQYWQGILPEAIGVGKDPMQSLSMDYSTIALASAITTAKSVVDHEERIAALEKENAMLKKEIEAIKAA